jgi:putative acetyltransferase
VYAEYGCVLDVERDERHLMDPGPYFRSKGGQFWVVESAGRILATGAVLLHQESAEMKTIYVHPSMRRQGWAKRLIGMAAGHALVAGARRMTLWSDTRFLNAHSLYESLGFHRSGFRELEDLNRSKEFGYEIDLAQVGNPSADSAVPFISDSRMPGTRAQHNRNLAEGRLEATLRCEACQAEIPLEHQKPKPHCRRCGWVLS